MCVCICVQKRNQNSEEDKLKQKLSECRETSAVPDAGDGDDAESELPTYTLAATFTANSQRSRPHTCPHPLAAGGVTTTVVIVVLVIIVILGVLGLTLFFLRKRQKLRRERRNALCV